MPSRSTLLDDRAIARALTRMASELVERCHGTSDMVLVGITRWPTANRGPTGHVTEVLGRIDEPGENQPDGGAGRGEGGGGLENSGSELKSRHEGLKAKG